MELYKFNVYDKRHHDYRWIKSFDISTKREARVIYQLEASYYIKANAYNVWIIKEDENLIVMDLPVSFILRQGLVESQGFAVEIIKKVVKK